MIVLHDAANDGEEILVDEGSIVDVGENHQTAQDARMVVLSDGQKLLVTEEVDEVRNLIEAAKKGDSK